MNRQKLLLVILLGVLALALVYAFWKTPRQRQVVATAVKKPGSKSRSSALKKEPTKVQTRLRIDLLNRENQPFPGAKKDIFGPLYVVKPPPPPPPPPVVRAPPVAPAPEIVQKQLAHFNFLGFLQEEGEKTVFLSSGNDIFVVKKGSRFGKNKEFQVAELTPEKLVIRQDDDPQPITVPLVEKGPLAPTIMKAPAEVGARMPSMPGAAGANPPKQPEENRLDTNAGENGANPPSPPTRRLKPPAEGVTR
ncbi:MAG: hypothetical protein P8Z70_07800 [Desulfuromonadales bacterium]|jgi:type IV secretory pathway VirB10-like protein